MTNYEKIAAILTFVALMCALVVNYSQSEEIQELRSRIDIMEAYFPVEIPDRSWK